MEFVTSHSTDQDRETKQLIIRNVFSVNSAFLYNDRRLILQVIENGVYCTIKVDGDCFGASKPEVILSDQVKEKPKNHVVSDEVFNSTQPITVKNVIAEQVAVDEGDSGVGCYCLKKKTCLFLFDLYHLST